LSAAQRKRLNRIWSRQGSLKLTPALQNNSDFTLPQRLSKPQTGKLNTFNRPRMALMLRIFSLLALFMLGPSVQAVDNDNASAETSDSTPATTEVETDSLVVERIERERSVDDNRSVLLAHKRNFFLPLTWAVDPNNEPYENETGDTNNELDNAEAQFQISLKLPIAEGIFTEQDAIYGAFTLRAFWQVYNTDISAPFRETNYEPEIFWVTPIPWNVFGGDATLLSLGLSHESNGRTQQTSRSWNRLYAGLIWERSRFVYYLKVWWRIPEDEKDDPLDPNGDDNPDIEQYMGNFEFTAIYRKFDHEVSVKLRNNLDVDDNFGAVQLDWTFPLEGRYRGYLQFFNGYGESLIDYDTRIERVGIGILLTDLL
jgi:phospholipase A1/A2